MNLKNKALALAIASAVAAPNAFAVQGSDGMHYTSASEGFYASIRAQFHSGDTDKDNSRIQNSGSRFGIQGTGEMSHGLEGFYRYEAALPILNGDTGLSTRLGYVGIRGGFGEVSFGSNWASEYNWVYGATDLPNAGGGNFVTYGGGVSDSSDVAGYRGRASSSAHYVSPNFNGLQVGLRFDLSGGTDDAVAAPDAAGDATWRSQTAGAGTEDMGDDTWVAGVAGEDGDLDQWALSAKYEFSGFTVAGAYVNTPDWLVVADYGSDGAKTSSEDRTEDLTSWAIRGGYGQDNWGVNVWYGENSLSDFGDGLSDSTAFSVSGNVGIGKTGVVVLHESLEYANGNEDTYTVIDIEYRLNSQAKTWIGYVARDLDSDSATEDYFNVGLRHDF